MNKIRIALIVMLVLSFVYNKSEQTSPLAQAQGSDSETPYLIQMLSMTPADAGAISQEGFLEIQYADLRANEQARPGVPTPANWTEFMELDENARSLWIANYQRLSCTAPDIQILNGFDSEMVTYYGLDYFEIDRTLYFGPPPNAGSIYGGHFSSDLIIETLTRRTYTTTDLNGIPVLCGPVGCEKGEELNNWLPDVGERDSVTMRRLGVYPLFGVRFGHQEPIAFPPGYLLSTPNWEIMGKMTAAATGTSDSLYEVSTYRTIADFAVTGSSQDTGGSLIQVLFFPPTFFTYDILEMLQVEGGQIITSQDLEELAAQIAEGGSINVNDLPLYPLGAIIDRQEGSDQMHSIVLVYFSEEDAQRAAAEVVKRIPQQSALPLGGEDEPLIDLAAPEYTLEDPQVVYNPETDLWLAVATVRIPMPANDPDPEFDKSIRPSGRLWGLWHQSLMLQSFTPVQLLVPTE